MNKKYKQTIIPTLDNEWDNLKIKDLAKKALDFYKGNIEKRKVKNLHKGIEISFVRSGIKHLLNKGVGGSYKYQMVKILPDVIKYAEFKNFKNPDLDDGQNIVGYLNFEALVNKNNEIEKFSITIRLTNEGKFYYHHMLKKKEGLTVREYRIVQNPIIGCQAPLVQRYKNQIISS